MEDDQWAAFGQALLSSHLPRLARPTLFNRSPLRASMTTPPLDGSTILVTGGAGFVGSALALRLKHVARGARVIAFDNLRRRGSELRVDSLRDAGVEFVHGDVREPADLA